MKNSQILIFSKFKSVWFSSNSPDELCQETFLHLLSCLHISPGPEPEQTPLMWRSFLKLINNFSPISTYKAKKAGEHIFKFENCFTLWCLHTFSCGQKGIKTWSGSETFGLFFSSLTQKVTAVDLAASRSAPAAQWRVSPERRRRPAAQHAADRWPHPCAFAGRQ